MQIAINQNPVKPWKKTTAETLVFLIFWNQEYFYYYFNISDGYIDYIDIFD